MAAIHDLLNQIQDEELRLRIEKEVDKISKMKKFGLVFEEHLPECTPLYDIPIKRGSTVSKRDSSFSDLYSVHSIKDGIATCIHKVSQECREFSLDELVTVAQFGEPIYPFLEPVDSICNAPNSKLWHTLIEADNYHALQLLEYLYAGKIDCIYIDPPYNTGEDDWKYNDSFVDSSDRFSHSKWLSFMKKRLIISSELLSESGCIVISIGYQELNNLCILCQELFKDKQVVPITVQTSSGKPSGGFNYLQEYLVFIVPQSYKPNPTAFAGGKENAPFHGMTLATFTQEQRPNQVYPIFLNEQTGQICGVGKSLQERIKDGSYKGDPSDFAYDFNEAPEGTVAIWPISDKGANCVWRLIPSRFISDSGKGYIKVLKQTKKKNPNKFAVQYLSEGIIDKIISGEITPKGKEDVNGTLILDKVESVGAETPTIWTEKDFYTSKGTSQLQRIFKSKEFPYPKPISLIVELLRACTNKDSIILDFFAGSGTTLNAANLLNKLDDGNRRCIIVTNNELSKKQTKALIKNGEKPGSIAWEETGICHAITWPRTKCSVLGQDINGDLLEDEYSPYGIPMSEGFESNVEYFRLGFLDKVLVSLGKQLINLIPLLWLKSGSCGRCPFVSSVNKPFLVFPENGFAILIDEREYQQFLSEIDNPDIHTVYIVTDSESGYQEMISELKEKKTYQLYRDYLDNFRINVKR